MISQYLQDVGACYLDSYQSCSWYNFVSGLELRSL